VNRTGRNEPCPCGSGKKYKRCCIDKPPFVTDRLTLRILELFKNNFESIVAAGNETRGKLNRRIFDLFEACDAGIDKRAVCIREYVDWLETQCAAIISRHHPIFWLSIDRRFPAWLSLGHPENPNEKRLLQELSVLKTAMFFKHGSKGPAKLKAYIDGTFEVDVSSADVIDLFGVLHVLLSEIINLQTVYRRVNKGANLEVGRSGELVAEPDRETIELMLLYDRRRHEFSTTFSPIGFFSAFEAKREFPSTELRNDHWSTLTFEFNEDRDYIYQIGSRARIRGPGFLPYRLSLNFLRFIEPFETQVEAVTGLTLRQLRLCFAALKNYICDRWHEEGTPFTYLNRGLSFAETSFLSTKLTECLMELFEGEAEQRSANESVAVFLRLLSSNKDFRQYDVLLRRGLGCLYESEELSILDLNLSVSALGHLMMDLQLDNQMRQIKGGHLETYIANRMPSDCPHVIFPMKPGLKLKRKGEKNAFAELDVYVQAGTLLFLVDCKAYSLTHEYFRGDRKAVENRWLLNEQWLEASDRRGHEISKVPEGANYTIPENVTHLIPVVCSAFPEFFWSLDENKFLVSKRTPRVCTYHELAELLNSSKLAELSAKAFAIEVRGTRPLAQAPGTH